MPRTLLILTVLGAVGLYYIQQEEASAELSITINSDIDTVWRYWKNVSFFREFHPFVSMADTIKESHLDDEYGTILADIQIVERPEYMPWNLAFITKRKTWRTGDKCFVEQISEPSDRLYLNITAILSENQGVTRIQEVAYIRSTKLFVQYVVSQFTLSYQDLLESTKTFIENLE